MENLLCIVDGTGPISDEIYRKSNMSSHCIKMRNIFKGEYLRGPSTLAMKTKFTNDEVETGPISDAVVRYVMREDPNKIKYLFLAGHSRGGAAVIVAARKLQEYGYVVSAMYLFDAVDRAYDVDGEVISKNVKHVYHALRNTNLSNFFEGDLSRAQADFARCQIKARPGDSSAGDCSRERDILEYYRMMDDAMRLRMRSNYAIFRGYIDKSSPDGRSRSVDFGNCGLKHAGGASIDMSKREQKNEFFTSKIFDGSHGAIGGAYIGGINDPNLAQLFFSDADSDVNKYFEYKNTHNSILKMDEVAETAAWEWMFDNFIESGLAKSEEHMNIRNNKNFKYIIPNSA